jgi:asparagine synthase (glutamine-hydrolysing)
MCGIAGYYSFNNAFSEDELKNMTDAIASRGPDAFGYFSDDVVGFGHRRLSVIDLSENANQPMFSNNKRYVMVYNGEVYNYREIAAELRQKHQSEFKTSSDSEVILEAFVQYGHDFVNKLNGMFAIAIYDRDKRELFLFRDRIGIKPLHYFWDGQNFAFASEIKALTKASFIPLKVDQNAVYQFLHTGFVPAPLSIYQSIKKLTSGTWIKVTQNKLESQVYWDLNKQVSKLKVMFHSGCF